MRLWLSEIGVKEKVNAVFGRVFMYFQREGEQNTDITLKKAFEYVENHNIKHIVIASKTGHTALKLADIVGNSCNVVCVAYHVGFYEPGKGSISSDKRAMLEKRGIPVLITTHLMAGLDRACRIKFGGVYPAEIIASALRIFGQGVKVCVEVAGMALDAGLIPYGEEVVAIAGSGTGADTAILILPAHSNNFFDTKVKEIICKPRDFEHH